MRALSDATAGLFKPVNLGSHDRLFIDCDKDRKHFVVRIGTDDEDGTIRHYPSATATRVWLARVPERKELKDRPNTWQLAATDYTAEIVRALWPESQIVWQSDKAKQLFDYLLLSTTVQDVNAEQYAEFKRSGKLPEDCRIEVHPEVPLAAYQKCAAALSDASEGYGLFMEQGTGKTAIVISRVCTEAATRGEDDPYRVLIVAPKNVRLNWVKEFQRFATQPGKIEVLRGGYVQRATTLIEAMTPEDGCKFTACVISYESMTRTIDVLTGVEWDLVVLDEAHAIKWPETQRAKASMKLRDSASKRMVLTGTPIGNSPLDLYSLFEFMGQGWSGFRSWQNFRAFYGVFKELEGDGYSKLVGIQNLPFMKERLARLAFLIKKEEALPELPEKLYDTDEVEMTGQQAEAYERVASQLMYQIENELDESENKAMTVQNILTQLLRLAQIACGYVVWDAVIDESTLEEARPRTIEWFTEDPKLDRLVEILKEKGPNDKTIVWSCFVPCIKRISERLEREGIEHVTFYGGTSEQDRVEAERKFNYEPSCRVLIGNPAAGGVGLNLLGYPPHDGDGHTTNCNHVIYYAQDWSYIKRAQSEDRAHRRGTRANVRITDLVVPDTIDEEIRVRVLKKKMAALEVSDIREILESILATMKARV